MRFLGPFDFNVGKCGRARIIPRCFDQQTAELERAARTGRRIQTKGSRKPPSGKENANKKLSKVKEEATKERKKAAIQWAKAKNFHLTDSLVTLIEENARYRQAFGFVKEAG
ncbi:hypothetical protein CPB84DRAFT_1747465 [Gymnopilus junonius]|uniref:Uncharacterized protein n=1 Tax=Gymnopilus junonius TaxID=109634 RepID=A0A9P5TNU0_GYMJU|nr:hypothetical protein CPB84DRAFT_1747465 [Gymnopilus junonius]